MWLQPPRQDWWHIEENAPSIAAGYNRILDRTEGPLVLVHDDVELAAGSRDVIVAALEDGADIVGQAGAQGVDGPAWWCGVTFGHVQQNDRMLTLGPAQHTHVDAVDGFILALSARVVDRWRFDEGYDGWHGYDADLCAHAVQQGWRIDVAAIGAVHHTKGGYGDEDAWARTVARWRSKWMPSPSDVSTFSTADI